MLKEQEQRTFLHRNKDCVAYIQNIRTLEMLSPIYACQNTWLTIGDYNGFEAIYFKEKGQKVLATDISEAFLKLVKSENLIDEYKVENVEHLSFAESSFDYVSCREAYHHFPRAFLGLYEMIRVSKKGVILIEPIDILAKMPLLLAFKNFCDIFSPTLINKFWKNRYSWETVGNYVFKLSEREVEKIAMGIGLPCIAFKGINVFLTIKENTYEVPTNKKLLAKLNRRLSFKNLLSKLRLIPYNTLTSIIFKEMPSEQLIQELEKNGYTVMKLPANPYLK
jgi:ubiquinone/menaquinone biosynthesis C-methylase UbiE